MKNTIPISVTIITKNEEHAIRECLTRLRDFEEVIIVDAESIDRTVEIARQFSNTKVFINPWPGFATQKNIAATRATNDWILNVDADEEFTPAVVSEIKEIFGKGEPDPKIVFEIPLRDYMWGKMMKWGTYGRRQKRLYNKKSASFTGDVHERLIGSFGETKRLKGYFIHRSHTSIARTIEKFNRYSDIEASRLFKKNPHRSLVYIFSVSLLNFNKYFLGQLLYRGAIRDGLHGIVASFLLGFYYFLIYIKYFELVYKKREHSRTNE